MTTDAIRDALIDTCEHIVDLEIENIMINYQDAYPYGDDDDPAPVLKSKVIDAVRSWALQIATSDDLEWLLANLADTYRDTAMMQHVDMLYWAASEVEAGLRPDMIGVEV